MLVVVSARMQDRVRVIWDEQIQFVEHFENKNKIWQLSNLPLTNDVYIFAPQTITRELLDQHMPLYVSLDNEDYMMVGGVKVKSTIKLRGISKDKDVVDWYTVHDIFISMTDLRKFSGNVVRQFAFGLNLPMNGSEIETIHMKNSLNFDNTIRGLRRPLACIKLNDGQKDTVYPWKHGNDEEKMKHQDLGFKKLESLLDATLEFDDYLIYVGASPGYSINSVLRKTKQVKYATLIDPKDISIDPRTFSTGAKTINVIKSYADINLIRRILEEWKNKHSKFTKRIYFFSDIRRDKEENETIESWALKTLEDEKLQSDMLDVLIDSKVNLKYMLKVRVDGNKQYMMHDNYAYIFPAPYSRYDLFELREYCPRYSSPSTTIITTRDMCDLIETVQSEDFSIKQKKGLFSLQIEEKNTAHDYEPSVDLFYLTDPHNQWEYDTFKLKAISSALSSWWTSDREPYEYGDKKIPLGWFTRLVDEVPSITVFRGDQFVQICRRQLNQMNKSVDLEWQGEFHYTMNLDLWNSRNGNLKNKIMYSVDAYFSQSRSTRQKLNFIKRFDRGFTIDFNTMKEYAKIQNVDISGHLRLMCSDGGLNAIDIPRWLRQVYSSVVMNDSSDKKGWKNVSESEALNAQKDAVEYEAKGKDRVWHTRKDLIWTIALMDVLRSKCIDPHAIYLPGPTSLSILSYDIDDYVKIKNELSLQIA